MAIDIAVADSLLVLSLVQAVFLFAMGNALFLRNQKGDANNVDVLHTLSEMKMARSKIWMILDRTGTNTWSDNMMGNNSVVSEWKENFKLPQPTPGLFFWRHFVSRCRGNKQLVDHFILNVPGVVVRISF